MSDRDHLDRLKDAADPQRVADALGLRGRGKRYFCPACQSDGLAHRTPDLAVGDKGFTCHKCGLKGDLLKLIEVTAGLDFIGAVRWLEGHTGIGSPAGVERGGYPGPGSPVSARPGASWRVPEARSGPVADPEVFDAFLDACRPVEGPALEWLTKDRGIAPAVVQTCRLRFCGREYPAVIKSLADRFGEDALLAAGLLKRSKTGRPVGSFWRYFAKKVGFLVIPYLSAGRPVYLKVRPPLSKDKAEGLGLARFLNTAAAIPCLYNVDVLATRPDRVLVCEGESDTWTAMSSGFAAVGVPGAGIFKPEWAGLFRDYRDAGGRSTVFLVFDADARGTEGARIAADIFQRAGLPVPRRVELPAGQDLTDFMKGGTTS